MLSLFKDFWRRSWTKIWSYIQISSAALLASLGELHNYLTDSTFKGYLSQLDLPKYVISGLAIAGIVTYLAHGHSKNESLV